MEARGSAGKKQACDNCKDRKTKCDRGSPCSSCIAAELNCKVTKRAPEKRQRVLISSRYDEAMENVNRSLEEVLQELKTLTHNNTPSREATSAASPGNHVSSLLEISEGHMGDSSFKAHVRRVTNALRDAAVDLELNAGDENTPVGTVTQMIDDAASDDPSPASADASLSSFRFKYPELEGKSLPSQEPVLKLLRLAQVEKQQFFVDMPIIEEQYFVGLCQKAYFAVDDYSLAAWAIVNTGLFHLFFSLKKHNYTVIGLSSSAIRETLALLTDNVEAAIRSFRICQDPSLETCRALAILTAFCMKSGRSVVAWTLLSAAARMCMDLGLHRLPPDIEGPDAKAMHRVFWHIYVMDKALAFTIGRTPSIHPHDVSTSHKLHRDTSHIPGALTILYVGFSQLALIMGDMHTDLYSANAERCSRQSRSESAKSLAARLADVNRNIRENGPALDPTYEGVNTLLDVTMHSLLTIIYRIIPCGDLNPHPLQCNADCIGSARNALLAIVRAHQTSGRERGLGWSMFLNMLFSCVPFASYVVLAGNTVASSSTEDLELLAATLTAIEPLSASSQSGKKIYDVCKSFYQVANFSVARQAAVSGPPSHAAIDAMQMLDDQSAFPGHIPGIDAPIYENVMLPQDWDEVMNEFDLGVGVGAMASFIEPYLPYPPAQFPR